MRRFQPSNPEDALGDELQRIWDALRRLREAGSRSMLPYGYEFDVDDDGNIRVVSDGFVVTVTGADADIDLSSFLTEDDIAEICAQCSSSGGGTSDHGLLDGLGDDDHPQYHNDARGDARYYTQAQVDTELAGKSDVGHTHVKADITDLSAIETGDAAGGVLGGTYPNPSFAVDMATQAELDAVDAAKSDVGHTHVLADVTDAGSMAAEDSADYVAVAGDTMTGALNMGSNAISGVTNLNGTPVADYLTTADEGSGNGLDADTVDAYEAADLLDRANHTGTQPHTTISDFDAGVQANALDEMAPPGANVDMNGQLLTDVDDPVSPQDAATKNYVDTALAIVAAGNAPIGAIIEHGGASAPSGWLLCYGQEVSRVTYADLFASIGTLHGSGDGSNTFNVPDYRGYTTAAPDDMGGTPANVVTHAAADLIGGTVGVEQVVLAITHMPPHDHSGFTGGGGAHGHAGTTSFEAGHVHDSGTLRFLNNNASGGDGTRAERGATAGAFYTGLVTGQTGQAGGHSHAITAEGDHVHSVDPEGGGTGHQNMQPTKFVNKIIYAGV